MWDGEISISAESVSSRLVRSPFVLLLVSCSSLHSLCPLHPYHHHRPRLNNCSTRARVLEHYLVISYTRTQLP